jgi:hypothetical protein
MKTKTNRNKTNQNKEQNKFSEQQFERTRERVKLETEYIFANLTNKRYEIMNKSAWLKRYRSLAEYQSIKELTVKFIEGLGKENIVDCIAKISSHNYDYLNNCIVSWDVPIHAHKYVRQKQTLFKLAQLEHQLESLSNSELKKLIVMRKL